MNAPAWVNCTRAVAPTVTSMPRAEVAGRLEVVAGWERKECGVRISANAPGAMSCRPANRPPARKSRIHLRQVHDVRAHTAGGRLRVGPPDESRLPVVADPHVEARPVRPAREVAVARAGGRHPERLVERLARQLRPTRSCRLCRGFAGRRDAVVAVGVRCAQRLERQVAQAAEDRRTAESEERLEQVAAVVGQPAAMGVEVGDRDPAGRHLALQPEARQVLDHRIVPVHGPASNSAGDHRRPDRLGHGRELKHGVLVDLLVRADPAHSEPLRVDDRVVLDDGDGHAGHARPLHHVGDHPVELSDRLVDLPRRNLHRRYRGRRLAGLGGLDRPRDGEAGERHEQQGSEPPHRARPSHLRRRRSTQIWTLCEVFREF